ncbi:MULTISPECIES: cryptochrome/photolyase family protein [Mesonia]|uniref:Deoxyribodipyrimidine photo-lyase n=1 Tax=Mesonia oceanica TaxID=2687242 RepID=A0AC61Y717_9FLAO|nr:MULTISPECIES: deoxyribodipyrimidine photo-lyase [Mesonia]MAN26745.1 deoxyribodipyrimidine photolyase [Mesonia sp.]MAQ40449.1 deoxyribodipyrimidine photolyase [Mesonia sp.]MBJ98070.1 deoxyribodipyrimidine photolyase [Flavobacteriaceae bacterium]VVV00286.1 Deoxyribodipyrimidine photo-lyase [Mesonia oceanica]|tara:strand:+ start:35206 stop:36516 length:1311 start_codon:yes stop_codon:yes gene_type:complete
MSTEKYTVFWFRRDLRLDDNIGFYRALQGDFPVLPIFIFDAEILKDLPKDDARVSFIFQELQKMRKELQENYDSSIAMFDGKPEEIFKKLIEDYNIAEVVTNRDYEPYAKERDEKISDLLKKEEIKFTTYKDQVIFEKDEVVKNDGDPYLVYTPYMKTWKSNFKEDKLRIFYTNDYLDNLIKNTRLPNLSLSDIGFKKSSIEVPDYTVTKTMMRAYDDQRNLPAKEGTSRLSVHLRFGTVSIRKMVKKAIQVKDETFFEELIWREFFMQILYHYPATVTDAFKKKYDRIEWRNNKTEFNKWKEGKTGYPLVDAGMRQLNESGFMHNRVRMVVGSFLCKHLLIDWRWGEAYFAEKLLDYEMSSNVGNWQWVAGSGVDAVPYFRIFNPISQKDKYDKDEEYIKKWIPEYGTDNYPEPIVEHKEARERCLKVYKKAVSN